MKYIDTIAKKQSFAVDFNTNDFRKATALLLLNASKNMTNVCLLCTEEELRARKI